MKDKRGFTLIELLGVITIVALLFVIAIPAVQKYIKRGSVSYYASIEGEMKTAGMDYLETYRTLLPMEIGNVTIIQLDELVANKYIDPVKGKDGNLCTGKVIVKKVKKDSYNYDSYLKCNDYSSDEELNEITEDDNEYPDTEDYEVEDVCTTPDNCPVEVCDNKNVCKDPNPPICTVLNTNCKIIIDPDPTDPTDPDFDIIASTIILKQGIGTIKMPLGTVYYKNNSTPFKTDLVPSPTRVDTSELGIKYVTYNYRGKKKKVKVIVVDTDKPTKPEIALRKDGLLGKAYLSSTWYSGNVMALFKSYDYAAKGLLGSGVAEYQISANNIDFTKMTAPFELREEEGEYTRYIRSVDNDGNISDVNQYTYRIDKTNPNKPSLVINGTPATDPSGKKWYKKPVTVTVTHNGDYCIVNKCSGVQNIKYKLTEATAKAYTIIENRGNVSLSNDGLTVVTAKVTDNADNVSDEESINVYLDQVKPYKPKITVVSGTEGTNYWYRSDVTLRFTHQGENCSTNICSGVKRVTYKVVGSGGAESESKSETDIDNEGTITLKAEGVIDVSAYVYDWAGNVSEQSIQIKIDKTAPPAPSVVATPETSSTSWTPNSVPIKITTYSDDKVNESGRPITVSGVYFTKYSKTSETSGIGENGSGEINSVGTQTITIVNSGITRITAYTQDYAGNRSPEVTVRTYIDKLAPPCLNINLSGFKGNNDWYRGDISVNITNCGDVVNGYTLSGYDRTTYSLSGAQSQGETTGTTFTINTEGTTYITAKGYDKVGNVKTSTATVKLDKTNPECPTLVLNPTTSSSNYLRGNVISTITTNRDYMSGIDYTRYVKTPIKFGESGSGTFTGTKSITLTDSGITKITATTYDMAGNSCSVDNTAYIDKMQPDCLNINTSGTPGYGEWFKSDVGITITNCGDSLSGYDRTTYSLSGSETKSETTYSPFTITGQNSTTITGYGYDKVNNRITATKTVRIDSIPPDDPWDIEVYSGTKGKNDWYVTDVKFRIKARSDNLSGVGKIAYTFSGAQYKAETQVDASNNGSIITDAVKTDGTTTVTAWVYDKAGNKSGSKTLTIKRDATPPDCILTGESTSWINDIRTLSYACDQSSESSVESGCSSETTGSLCIRSFVFTTKTSTEISGTNCKVLDKAGNAGTCKTKLANVYVDTTAPTRPTITRTGGSATTLQEKVTVTISSSDADSGIKSISYRLTPSDNEKTVETTTGSISFEVSANGNYDIVAYATDNAGNISSPTLNQGPGTFKIEIPNFQTHLERTGVSSHTHEGKPTKKGGCYQGAKIDGHKHTDSCYETKTVYGVHISGQATFHDNEDGTFTISLECSEHCSDERSDFVLDSADVGDKMYAWDHSSCDGITKKVLTCGKDTKATYALSCTKTPVQAKIKIEIATNVDPVQIRATVVENGTLESFECTKKVTSGTYKGTYTGTLITSDTTTTSRTLKVEKLPKNTYKYTCKVKYKSGTNATTTGITTSTTSFIYAP